MNNITEKILKVLQESGISFEELEHEGGETCDLSSRFRGLDKKFGGKTILFKAKDEYYLFTLSAAKEIDNNKVRKIVKSAKLRFASNDELMDLCGVIKGALPPLGKLLYPYKHFCDESIVENDKIAFNAGVLTKSIILKTEDYLRIVNPEICQCSK